VNLQSEDGGAMADQAPVDRRREVDQEREREPSARDFRPIRPYQGPRPSHEVYAYTDFLSPAGELAADTVTFQMAQIEERPSFSTTT
jgi:hypothetical protein